MKRLMGGLVVGAVALIGAFGWLAIEQQPDDEPCICMEPPTERMVDSIRAEIGEKAAYWHDTLEVELREDIGWLKTKGYWEAGFTVCNIREERLAIGAVSGSWDCNCEIDITRWSERYERDDSCLFPKG